MDLKSRLAGLPGRGGEDCPEASLSGGCLTVDCRGCEREPDPGSPGCIACMVGCMCRLGGADRLVLRTGRDVEVSGAAGRAVKEAASLRRWSVPDGPEAGRCRRCPASRSSVMAAAWEAFPAPGGSCLGAVGVPPHPDREECDECAARTARALGRIEEGMAEIEASLSGRGSRCRSQACLVEAPAPRTTGSTTGALRRRRPRPGPSSLRSRPASRRRSPRPRGGAPAPSRRTPTAGSRRSPA